MKIALRLLREFWVAFVLAAAWTVYTLRPYAAGWDVRAMVSTFAPSFFLISWATGQFFRVQKQAGVDRYLTSIEARVDSLMTRLEKHTKDFMGYATGADSKAYFQPMFREKDVLELGLMNDSEYPVFDFHSRLIDIDEPIDPKAGKFWTDHLFSTPSLYPSRILMSAYRFSLAGRDRLRVNIFINTRGQGLTQQIRVARVDEWFAVAVKTTVGNDVVEVTVPPNFPGRDPANLEAVFA